MKYRFSQVEHHGFPPISDIITPSGHYGSSYKRTEYKTVNGGDSRIISNGAQIDLRIWGTNHPSHPCTYVECPVSDVFALMPAGLAKQLDTKCIVPVSDERALVAGRRFEEYLPNQFGIKYKVDSKYYDEKYNPLGCNLKGYYKLRRDNVGQPIYSDAGILFPDPIQFIEYSKIPLEKEEVFAKVLGGNRFLYDRNLIYDCAAKKIIYSVTGIGSDSTYLTDIFVTMDYRFQLQKNHSPSSLRSCSSTDSTMATLRRRADAPIIATTIIIPTTHTTPINMPIQISLAASGVPSSHIGYML